ncbi:MAG: uroporphyrinogen-III C-methyltransferase [Nitriliruptorales bacterium]|nr:uroporphyrinogen-III C-methyltransferase [Nitriliruptorales bacterium]
MPFGGPPAEAGTVYLVGGGPGDPGLVTLRGAQLLATATVIAHDRLSPPEPLTLRRDDAELINVGKQPARHALSQDEINDLLVVKAAAGEAVVRFKGGDPFVLARGSEEAQACAVAGIPFQVVPGITSGIAAPAYAGIPVTHRSVAPAFAVVTGHEDPSKGATQADYAALARFPGTLLLYMGMGRLGEIAAALVDAGRPATTPVALVEWGTTPRQRTVTATLADVADRARQVGLASPAIIVVGDVVALRDEIGWFEQRPLHGMSVLVPRTRHQASELSERLRTLGADPVEAPTIAIEPSRATEALRDAVASLVDGAYDWVVFTSSNGVDATWAHVEQLGGDARWFSRVRLGAVGSGTAEALWQRGLLADVVPERQTTRALAQALIAAASAAAPRALLPRADLATPTLTAELRDAGWDADDIEAYRTVAAAELPDGVAERIRDGGVDAVAFASSSTVRNLVDLLGGTPPPATRIVSIGPVTSQTCREVGMRVDAEAESHDIDGLVAAVVAATRTG